MLSLSPLIATPDIHDPACPGIQSNAVPLAVLAGPVVIIPRRTIGGANRIVSAMIYDPSAMRAAQAISIGISIVAQAPLQYGNPGIPNQRYTYVLASAAEVPMARNPANATASAVREINFLSMTISPYPCPIENKSPHALASEKQDT